MGCVYPVESKSLLKATYDGDGEDDGDEDVVAKSSGLFCDRNCSKPFFPVWNHLILFKVWPDGSVGVHVYR